MHNRDYIMRQIEQLGAFLAELRRRIIGRGSSAAEMYEALQDVAGQAGLNVDLLRVLDARSLHALVAPTGEVDMTRCWLMAEILYLDGLQASVEERNDEAEDSLVKAWSLFDLVRPRGGMLIGFPEADDRIREIHEVMDDLRGHGRGRTRSRRVLLRRRPAFRAAMA